MEGYDKPPASSHYYCFRGTQNKSYPGISSEESIWYLNWSRNRHLFQPRTKVSISRNNSATIILVLAFRFEQEERLWIFYLQTVTTNSNCFQESFLEEDAWKWTCNSCFWHHFCEQSITITAITVQYVIEIRCFGRLTYEKGTLLWRVSSFLVLKFNLNSVWWAPHGKCSVSCTMQPMQMQGKLTPVLQYFL